MRAAANNDGCASHCLQMSIFDRVLTPQRSDRTADSPTSDAAAARPDTLCALHHFPDTVSAGQKLVKHVDIEAFVPALDLSGAGRRP